MRKSKTQSLFFDLQTRPASRAKQNAVLRDPAFVTNLDRVQVLGDSAARHDEQPYGHTGCVNALCWSPSGSLLASGSDDFRICLWKLGQQPDFTSELDLGLALNTTINTGHTRNIFSVKFAPYSSESRLLSCAGDGRVRVFDLNRVAAEPARNGGRTFDQYSDSSCVRTLRCHRDRVKRISIEDSPDVFLTCSEDGTVRQHDLRTTHDCKTRSSCPPPLARHTGCALYSLSLAKSRPELFVCAGTAPHAFLHDRRMFRQTLRSQWGVQMEDGQLSQCVREFGLKRDSAPLHITAAKISEDDSSQLLVSYSEGPVALFDMFGDPASPPEVITPESRVKRNRTESPGATAEADNQIEIEEEDMSTDSEGEDAVPADRPSSTSEIPLCLPTRLYTGHQNSETVKDVNFGFADSRIVMSGSDDGRLFLYDLDTGDIVNILEGDSNVVNVMTTHPRLPILAVSGIDSSIKIFAPTTTKPRRYSAMADKDRIVAENTTATSRQRSTIPVSSALLQLLSRRIVATEESDGEEDEGIRSQRALRLTSDDVAQLLARPGAEGEDCCIS